MDREKSHEQVVFAVTQLAARQLWALSDWWSRRLLVSAGSACWTTFSLVPFKMQHLPEGMIVFRLYRSSVFDGILGTEAIRLVFDVCHGGALFQRSET